MSGDDGSFGKDSSERARRHAVPPSFPSTSYCTGNEAVGQRQFQRYAIRGGALVQREQATGNRRNRSTPGNPFLAASRIHKKKTHPRRDGS